MANSMITIDATHQGSHCLGENDWFCLAGSCMYVAAASCSIVCVSVWEVMGVGSVSEVVF